jgi:hypothetical protein
MRVAAALVVAVLLLGCADGGEPRSGSEAHLQAYLDEEQQALIEGDVDSLFRLQNQDCPYTLAEVVAGYGQGLELFRQEFGLELGDVVADMEAEIVSFDEGAHTARVLITYVGTNEAFIDDNEDSEADIYWLADDGIWVGSACVAEAFG